MPETPNLSLPFLTREMLDFNTRAQISLQVKLTALVTSNIEITGYTKAGPFVFRMTHAGDGTITTTNIPLPDLPIAVSISTSAAGVLKGRIYARVSLRIDGNVVQELTRGYVHDLGSPAWPAGYVEENTPYKSSVLVVSSANPAAGSEISLTLESNRNWRILGAVATLVTDGTVANRRPHLVINHGGSGTTTHYFGDTDQTASTTRTYNFLPMPYAEDREDNSQILVPIPQDVCAVESSVITTSTTNLQAGDNWGAMSFIVEQFLSR